MNPNKPFDKNLNLKSLLLNCLENELTLSGSLEKLSKFSVVVFPSGYSQVKIFFFNEIDAMELQHI